MKLSAAASVPRAPRRGGPWTALVVAAAGLLFFARLRERVDPDLFFHLKDGERVLVEHRLPLVEEYSYTRAGKAMVATEWLSSALLFAAFRLGGYPAVAALGALLLAGALWLTAAALEEGPPEELRALLIALTAFGLLPFALAKAQDFTFLLFALFLYWLRLWERGRVWVPWAMAATLAVWVNLHGGFMLGWGLLGAACVLDFLRARRVAALAPWWVGTAACFLHPNGATAFVYPLWFVFAAPAGRSFILEWTPLDWSQSPAAPYALLMAAAAAARIDRLRSRFPWTPLAAALLAMGLRSRKMLPYFASSASVAAGLALVRARLDAWRSRLSLAGALASLLAIGAVEAREASALASLGPVSDWQREYPRGAADEIASRYPGRHLFHPYEWGAYLLYRLAPRTRVFIDGRLDPYWTLIEDYDALMKAKPGWEILAARYEIELALLPRDAPLARALAAHPRWMAVGSDARTVLYARRDLRP